MFEVGEQEALDGNAGFEALQPRHSVVVPACAKANIRCLGPIPPTPPSRQKRPKTGVVSIPMDYSPTCRMRHYCAVLKTSVII